MGQVQAAAKNPEADRWDPKVEPDWANDPTFPHNYGFIQDGVQRKERVFPVTKQELISAKVPTKHRDFCAHKYIQYKSCARAVYPYTFKCEHEKHEWSDCMEKDYLISMKEYERERRLLVRQDRKEYLNRLKGQRRKDLEKSAEHHEKHGSKNEEGAYAD